MKEKYLLDLMVMMVLLTSFCSCSDDDKEGTFYVGKSDVFMMVGNKDNILLLPNDGNFTVKSLDESIATGEIKKTDNGDGSIPLLSVSVSPVSKGKTTLVISNGIEEKHVNVTVVDAYMVFDVRNQIITSMVDMDKGEAVMEELNKDHFLNMGNVFMLVKDEDHTMYLFESEDDVDIDESSKSASRVSYKLKGSYEMVKSGDKFYLVLKSGDRSTRFEIGGNSTGQSIIKSFFNLNSLKSENTVPEYLAQVTFMENLTEEYNTKFQGGISFVGRDYTCTILSQRMYKLPFEE